ncbi:hypothetical protein [Xanthomonas bonasiae]|uniref:hypothetical protein n=1 Tax=Xanthomonas bonasiae TaxID=2810351 RepID=UPI00197FFA05|nr:hypothetical protein [Xanthomonas bonasiae]MBN6113354.1 hypothetical protein [Xanthomonas bonasiae]
MKKWMQAVLAAALCLAAAAEVVAQDAAAPPSPAAATSAPVPSAVPTLALEDLQTLLSARSAPAAREQMLAQLVALAGKGDGMSAYVLGVLYRNGEAHPAHLVPREPDTARYWLERCLGMPRCPLLALASLAELELSAGRAKPALQWAQGWVALDREFTTRARAIEGRTLRPSQRNRDTAYHAYLLERCYAAMPAGDRDALGLAWFNEFRGQWGGVLDRMLFAQIDALQAQSTGEDSGLAARAENQRRKTVLDSPMDLPVTPALSLFLLRGDPQGGRPESALVVEALPSPNAARGLEALAHDFKTAPYPAQAGQRRYDLMPMSFNRGPYALTGK